MFEAVMSMGTLPRHDPAQLEGGERVEAVVARERLIARLQAEQAELVAAHAAETAPVGGLRGAAGEVALARGVSPAAAEHQVHVAQVLVCDLPGLFGLLHRGEISWAGACAVVREIGVVDPVVRREIDRRLAATVEVGAARRVRLFDPDADPGIDRTAGFDPDSLDPETGGPLLPAPPPEPAPALQLSGSGSIAACEGFGVPSAESTVTEVVRGVPQVTVLPEVRPLAATTSRLGAAARRLVLVLDAEAATKRAERAADERRVDLVAGPAGASDPSAALVVQLPAAQAAACWHALDHHARGVRADGDDRSICQLMADTLVERLTGVSAVTGPPPPHAQVQVVVKASTLTGANDHPALIVGHGPVTAAEARSVAASATATWRRLVVDEAGRAVTMDRTTRPASTAAGAGGAAADWLEQPIDWTVPGLDTASRCFTGDLRTFVFARDGTCRMPVCATRITDGDHIRAYAAGGRTTAANGQGLSRRCHHLRDLPGWHVTGTAQRTIWTTPTGHRYQSLPPPVLGWGSEPP